MERNRGRWKERGERLKKADRDSGGKRGRQIVRGGRKTEQTENI